MPITSYFDNVEPSSSDVEIWRFMPFNRFQDFMGTDELFFCRADLFPQDEEEGIPPETYIRHVMGYRRYDVDDEVKLNNDMGNLAQFREMQYVSCWHLFRKEVPEMWEGFAQYGVAIRSRYDLLKGVLDKMLDKTHIGLMRYGEERLYKTMKVNVLQFINTKREKYRAECEVRAIVECSDPLAGMNRHYDSNGFPHRRPLPENPLHHWVPPFKRRRVELAAFITGIVVSPGASDEKFNEAQLWVDVKKLSCKVEWSLLRGSL
jgi:hypothetical protein